MNLDGSILSSVCVVFSSILLFIIIALQVIDGLYPHNIGHYLGLDVHDCQIVSQNAPLVPGMVLTIEPGVYIPKGYTIKDTHKQEYVHVICQQCNCFNYYCHYRLIGTAIRIEDNIVITEDGCEIINSNCPETVDDICSLMLK